MKRLDMAKKIRFLRQKLKLNQKQFGKLVGLSQQMVSKLESGESGYTLGLLEKIASGTGVNLDINFKLTDIPISRGMEFQKTIPTTVRRTSCWTVRRTPCWAETSQGKVLRTPTSLADEVSCNDRSVKYLLLKKEA